MRIESASFTGWRIAPSAALCLAALAMMCSPARAQYGFTYWTTDNGLPQNSVRAILQTRDGYLWFTTLDGVVRFDGVRFTVFNKGNTREMRSNRFFALLEDREGALWMATEDGGVCRHRNGSFVSYGVQNGLPSDQVLALVFAPDGAPLVYTHGGAARWAGVSFAAYTSSVGEPEPGLVYQARDGGVWSWNGESRHWFKNGGRADFALPPGAEPTALCQDRGGRLWIGAADGRLFTLTDGVLEAAPIKPRALNSFVRTIIEDRDGNLWIGTRGEGLARLRDGQCTFYTTANGLSDNHVFSLFEDREGTIWVGTFNRGIDRVDKQIISVYSKKDGMTGDVAYPIYQDRSGAVWIGAGGLNRFSRGRFTTYSSKDGLHFYDAMSLLEDRDGRLWIGAVGGLSYLKDGRFTNFTGRLPLRANDFNVWAVFQDSRGALWFGTDRGLAKFENDSVALFTVADGLAGNDVKCIHEARDGRLWLGTYGGLTYSHDGRFAALTEADGLASNRVRTIHEDDDGTLWIGTYDGGLSRYKDGKFTNYTTANGLFSDGVFQILDDLRGNFWIGSNRGIYRLKRQELVDFAEGRIKTITSVAYGKEDGLISTECNGGRQPDGLRTPDGKLWIPTQGGVAVIDAANLTTNLQPPPVAIEGAIVNHRPAPALDALRLGPGDANLEIDYTGLSFIKPQQVRFRYMMEGLDRDWVDAGSRRQAYYSYLPPGTYTFTVMAANSDGAWSVESKRMRITVLPPFWRTWWFIAVAATGGAALIAGIYRRRIAGLQRARLAQQKFSRQLIDSQESERKRIASELHDSLGQNLLVIKNWAMLGLGGLNEGDRAGAELSEISTAASQAIREVREISYNLRPHLLDEVGLTEALQAMIKRVAAASGIAFSIAVDPIDGAFSKDAEIYLYRIVQEGLNNIVRHSKATEASVGVRRSEREAVIDIVDNGIGLAASAVDGRKGLGLTGMSERARMLGGAFTAHSAAGQGTRLEVRIGLGPHE